MKKYFYLEESPYNPGYYVISLEHSNFPFSGGIRGSYNIIIARILNLSYANFLRYSRDVLGARISGKETYYIVPYFKRTKEVDQLIKLLNSRMEMLIHERENRFEIKENNGILEKIPLEFKE